MKHILLLLLLCSPLLIKAQYGFVVTGGDVKGTEGSVSFSAGHIFLQTTSYGEGSLMMGIQHPHETVITSFIEIEDDVILHFVVYPVPAVDYLFLEVSERGTYNLSYQLFDLTGRLLKEDVIGDSHSRISLHGLDPAIYFIRIIHNNKVVEVMRILKQ